MNDDKFDNMIAKIEDDMNENFIRTECAVWLYNSSTGDDLSSTKIGKMFHRALKTKTTRTRVNGVPVRIYKFYISYGIAKYHLAGSSHHFSLSMNFNEFYKKKNK